MRGRIVRVLLLHSKILRYITVNLQVFRDQ